MENDMNKTKIREVALALLQGPVKVGRVKVGYNQTSFGARNQEDYTGHHCSTTACIAGWAVALDGKNPRTVSNVASEARKLLGLNEDQALDLFAASPLFNRAASMPYDGARRGRNVQPRDAALVLFNLAETGVVDWKIAA